MSHTHDIAIVGAGAAGITGARFAVRLGARVVLIERHRVGGDCTWTGCVPSKALVRAARAAREVRDAARFGIQVGDWRPDMRRVHDYVRSAVAKAYRAETPESLAWQGIEVVVGSAEFLDRKRLRVAGRTLAPRRVVICTGARPAVPEIAGLQDVPFLTSEQIFDNDRLPRHLIVVGAGPLGLEIAQAYRALGAEVTVIGRRVLPREEPEVQSFVLHKLQQQAVRVVCESAQLEVADEGPGISRPPESVLSQER